MRWITKTMPWRVAPLIDEAHIEDTSWVAVLMAYISCRGVVQWIINFWIIKDNYFEGRMAYSLVTMFAYIVKTNVVVKKFVLDEAGCPCATYLCNIPKNIK